MLVGVPVWPAGPKQARHMGPRAASKGSKMYENGSWDRAGHQGILPNLRTVHLLSNSVQPIRANGAAWLPLSSVSFVCKDVSSTSSLVPGEIDELLSFVLVDPNYGPLKSPNESWAFLPSLFP